jgi:excisionase family DNA binding protein
MLRHDLNNTNRLLLRPREAAASLGVSLRTLMSMVAAGTIPAVRLHTRCLRFSPDALRQWIAERTTAASPAINGTGAASTLGSAETSLPTP